MSGLKKAYLLNQNSSHLILTTSPVTAYGLNDKEMFDLLHQNFHLLKRHLERYHNIKIRAYHRVTTNEGYGVIHALIIAPFIPQSIIAELWNEIHGSQIVHIRSISHDRLSHGKVSHYFTSQYLKDQHKATMTRYGISKEWVYPHFVNDWNNIKKDCQIFESAYTNSWGYLTYKIDIEKALNLWNVRINQLCDIWLVPEHRKVKQIKKINKNEWSFQNPIKVPKEQAYEHSGVCFQ